MERNFPSSEYIIKFDNPILVTGATGFIGSRVVLLLAKLGFKNIRAFVRDTHKGYKKLIEVLENYNDSIELIAGNLLYKEDCEKAADRVSIIYHLAMDVSDKSFTSAFLNSVVTTRNLVDAAIRKGSLKRFVNVSSLGVYSNITLSRKDVLDENCKIESHLIERGDAYIYGKVKQDELVMDYGRKYGLPYVIVRPGAVIGPGKNGITGRVGINTFGFFIHLGGSNKIPFTFVDNCAEAIILAGLKEGINGEIFNIIDDDLPTGRQFLRLYKKRVKKFPSFFIPYGIFYLFCLFWDKYSRWSKGQIPPVFNKYRCSAEWKGNLYSNRKAKDLLGWKPKILMDEALERYFKYQKIFEDQK